MTKKERKDYVINRCYAAYYDQLPKPFKTVNALRYPGLWLSILMNPELFKLENLTPECTDVLVTTARWARDASAYYADYETDSGGTGYQAFRLFDPSAVQRYG